VKQRHKRLTYANVMSSIAVFLVLGGGAAFAVSKLPKKSVGTQQLKTGSVTAAKLKKNAVTKAKIKDGAVDGSKIADGSVTGTEINAASTPFSQVVARLRGTASLAVTAAAQLYPLSNPTYTQAANEDDSFLGALDVTFQAGCTQPRTVQVYAQLDSPNPLALLAPDVISFGAISDTGAGAVNRRVEMGPLSGTGSTRLAPGVDKAHTVTLYVVGSCTAGSGITATFGAIDVIGTK
jgi:hypothetical protein